MLRLCGAHGGLSCGGAATALPGLAIFSAPIGPATSLTSHPGQPPCQRGTRWGTPCERKGGGSRCQSTLRSSSGVRPASRPLPATPFRVPHWWDWETSPLQGLSPVLLRAHLCCWAGSSGDAETAVPKATRSWQLLETGN